MAIAVSDLGTLEDTGTDQSSFSFGSFGAEASDRYLIALVHVRDGATNYTATACTIGGVSADIRFDNAGAHLPNVVVAVALVPTGASGTVTVTWSEAITNDQNCTLYRVTGLANSTLYDSATDGASTLRTSASGSIDCPAGGLIIGLVSRGGVSDATHAWTNLANETEDKVSTDAAVSLSNAYEVFASAQTNLSVSVSWTTSSGVSFGVVSFAPATAGSVSPPAANIDFAAPAPTVSVYSTGSVSPPAANIDFAAPAPTVTGVQVGAVAPPAANIDFAAPAPTVTGVQVGSVSPPAADIAFAAPAPTVSVTGSGATSGLVEPPAANITFAAPAPTVTGVEVPAVVEPPAAGGAGQPADLYRRRRETLRLKGTREEPVPVKVKRRAPPEGPKPVELYRLPTGQFVTAEELAAWWALERDDEEILLLIS